MIKLSSFAIKYFYSAKDTIKRMQKEATDWRKSLTKYLLVSRIYREFRKLNNKKINNII